MNTLMLLQYKNITIPLMNELMRNMEVGLYMLILLVYNNRKIEECINYTYLEGTG